MSRFAHIAQQAEDRQQQKEAEAARLAEEQRLAHRSRLANRFVEKFEKSFERYVLSKEWSPAAIVTAEPYFEALISREDTDFPSIGQALTKLMNDLFVDEIIRFNDNQLRDVFAGQRQDWFPALYKHRKHAPKKAKVERSKAPAPKPMHSSSSESSDNNQSSDSDQETGTVAKALGEEKIGEILELFKEPDQAHAAS